MLYEGVSPLQKMQSVTAMLLLAGAGATAAQAIQAAVALGAIGFVAWLWRRDAAFEYKAAGLGLAALLASPYVYHYDLTLLGVAMLWYGRRARAIGWQRWDRQAIALAWLTPMLAFALGSTASLVVTPALLLAFVALVIGRVRADEGATMHSRAPALPAAA